MSLCEKSQTSSAIESSIIYCIVLFTVVYIKACKQQVERMSTHFQPAQLQPHHQFDFNFDESKKAIVEVNSPASETWKVKKRTTACEVRP